MHRKAYLDAATIAVDLLADPAVADRWERASALTELTVGGLAGHLGRQIDMIVELLDGPAANQAPRDLMAHYGDSAWLGKDVDNPANVGIRAQSAAFAEPGHARIVETLRADLGAIGGTLPTVPTDRAVLLPWTGWALSLDDLLLTRMMEITVHCDDLAVSVDVPTPTFPPRVVRPVLGLLTDLAVARHGQTAIVRALSRRERAPETISAL